MQYAYLVKFRNRIQTNFKVKTGIRQNDTLLQALFNLTLKNL